MVPVIELRGAIPIGVGMGLPFWAVIFVSIIGNLVPVPFIIIFIKKIFAFMREKMPKLDGLVTRLENKANSKSETVQKYTFWGLFIFVAIPLPGTGAWTGALIAAMLEMKLEKSIPVNRARRAFRRGNSYLCNIPCACNSTLFCIGDRPCRFAKTPFIFMNPPRCSAGRRCLPCFRVNR